MRPNEWTATASQVAGLATATKAAETDRRHVAVVVVASYSAAQIGLLTIKRGASVVAEHYIHNSDIIPLDLRGNNNEAISAELAAGTAGVTGKVAIAGYTE